MGTSNDTKKSTEYYRKNAAKSRKGKLYKLDEEKFKKVLAQFYIEAEKSGFYTVFEDAIEENGYFFTDHQRVIAVDILKAVFMKISTTINISITRQFGKTELVTLVISFCYDYFFKIFGEPFKCCIIAPEKGTASEVFNRAANYILAKDLDMATNTKSEKRTNRGDVVQLFGIYEDAKGGTVEGRTFNLVVRDEAHLGDDVKFADQVEPTAMRTGGSIVMIGNGAERNCTFRTNVMRGNCDILSEDARPINRRTGERIGEDTRRVVGKNIVHRYTYNTLRDYMEKLAQRGLESSRAWINGTEKYIAEKGGRDSIMVRKNILCQFMVNLGNFLSMDQLERCRRRTARLPAMREKDLYLGVDFATKGDRSVAAFVNKDRQIEDWVILKDANEIKSLTSQLRILYDYCDEKGIFERLAGIGGDSTGMGIGAIEIMEGIFGCEIVPYNFSQRKKHEWYTDLKDLMMTLNKEDRLHYDPLHEHAPIFEKEMTELEVTASKNGILSFSAPEKHGCYDDFVAATAIANSMRARNLSLYSNRVKPRTDREVSISLAKRAKNMRDRIFGRPQQVEMSI